MPTTLLTSAETAALLRVPPRTLEAWRARRIGPPYLRLGRRVAYRADDVDQWIAGRVIAPGRAEADR